MLEAEINASKVQNLFAIGILGDEGDVPFGGFDVFDKKLRRLIDHRLVRYPHASRQFFSELVSNTIHFSRGYLYHIGRTTKIASACISSFVGDDCASAGNHKTAPQEAKIQSRSNVTTVTSWVCRDNQVLSDGESNSVT